MNRWYSRGFAYNGVRKVFNRTNADRVFDGDAPARRGGSYKRSIIQLAIREYAIHCAWRLTVWEWCFCLIHYKTHADRRVFDGLTLDKVAVWPCYNASDCPIICDNFTRVGGLVQKSCLRLYVYSYRVNPKVVPSPICIFVYYAIHSRWSRLRWWCPGEKMW